MDHKKLGPHETVDIIQKQIEGKLPIGGIFYDSARSVINAIMQELPLDAPAEAVDEAYGYSGHFRLK